MHVLVVTGIIILGFFAFLSTWFAGEAHGRATEKRGMANARLSVDVALAKGWQAIAERLEHVGKERDAPLDSLPDPPPDPFDEAERRYHGKLAIIRRGIVGVAMREPFDPDHVHAAVVLYKKAEADSPFRVDPARDRTQAIVTAALLVPFDAGAVMEAADAYRHAMEPDQSAATPTSSDDPPAPTPSETA